MLQQIFFLVPEDASPPPPFQVFSAEPVWTENHLVTISWSSDTASTRLIQIAVTVLACFPQVLAIEVQQDGIPTGRWRRRRVRRAG